MGHPRGWAAFRRTMVGWAQGASDICPLAIRDHWEARLPQRGPLAWEEVGKSPNLRGKEPCKARLGHKKCLSHPSSFLGHKPCFPAQTGTAGFEGDGLLVCPGAFALLLYVHARALCASKQAEGSPTKNRSSLLESSPERCIRAS